ncbi:MAG: hypothetical protein IKG39_10680 [Lachnospiraceae bacterium]|nr:hypothetical protein [Lachnospiraceae bacterium]
MNKLLCLVNANKVISSICSNADRDDPASLLQTVNNIEDVLELIDIQDFLLKKIIYLYGWITEYEAENDQVLTAEQHEDIETTINRYL